MMESIWQKNIKKPQFESLKGDIKTDVLIIGGGIVGILTGYMLKEAGVDFVIAEKDTVCGGVKKNTTAKITCHHGAVFNSMIKMHGIEKSKLYIKAQNEAIEKYKQLSIKFPCDFETKDSYVYSRSNREKVEKEVKALNKIGCPAEFVNEIPLPISLPRFTWLRALTNGV